MNYRFASYEALLHLREALGKYPHPELQREVSALIAQVQARRYVVAVAGEFNRGKSSLINALLGMPILPMDVLPMTATVNRIVYGLTPCVRIHKKDGSEMHIKVSELSGYVTKLTDASREAAKTIRETVIEYPTLLCQNGLEILDTPGLNDTEEMTRITGSILQEAHAVVFAVSAMMPLSMSEVDWLARLISSEKLQYLMFAVTFFDRVAARDRKKVLDNIRSRLSTMVQSRVRELYPDHPELLEKAKRLTTPETMFLMPVASRDALDAFDLGDDELLQKSNLPQFKMALTTVLNAQQDEYALRRTWELLRQVQSWLKEAVARRDKLAEAELLSLHCGEALRMLDQYVCLVKQKTNQLYESLEAAAIAAPDAYRCMKDASNAVIDAHRESIQTNDDVHSTLQIATAAAKKAARSHYRDQWKERCHPLILEHADQLQFEHDMLLEQCEAVLDTVPQLMSTEDLNKSLWNSLGARLLPELPEEWHLDITGGMLRSMVAGGQRAAENIGRTVSTAAEYLEKNSPGFRHMKGRFNDFLRKSGIAERVESIELPRVDVKEGLLVGRNLSAEIESRLSEGATLLVNKWHSLPAAVGPVLHQVYLVNEGLLVDTSLRMALTRRRGEADAMVAQYTQDAQERFDGAMACISKAEKALGPGLIPG